MVTLVVFVSPSLSAQQGPSVSGVWAVSDVTNAPWTFTLTQSGGPPGISQIFEGSVTGNSVFFKARSGDGSRTITFAGTRSGDSIAFKRTVENVRAGVSGAGVFGASGAAEFTARLREGSAPRIPGLPAFGRRSPRSMRPTPGSSN